MLIKKGEIPAMEIKKAVKKPIPVRCIKMNEDFQVETMEGLMHGKAGDYLMIGQRGEMYPCDLDIFNETYDIVD